jgi:hypothetical protein
MPQTLFFAFKDELAGKLQELGKAHGLRYVRQGMSEQPEIELMEKPWALAEFGVSRTGNEASDDRFLVLPAGVPVRSEAVTLKNGTVTYFVHPGKNPASILLAPGGVFGQDCLMGGHVWWGQGDDRAKAIYAEFTQVLKSGWKPLKGYRLSPQARAWMQKGSRLVIRSNHEDGKFDLREMA